MRKSARVDETYKVGPDLRNADLAGINPLLLQKTQKHYFNSADVV